MALATTLAIFIFVLIWLISAIPLYFALRLVGDREGLIKVAVVNLVAGLVSWFISSFIGSLSGSILGFIGLLFVYKSLFDITWSQAFGAWFLQIVVAIVMFLGAIFLLGIAIF